MHWDDDDWSSPDRIEVQVSALLDTGADICGLRELLFYEPATDRGWSYRYPQRARPWVAGGTMCYRRSLWEANPFPDVRQGEDTRFVWSSRSLRVHAINRLDLYVATIHQTNTSAKRTSGSRWSSVPTAEILAILGDAAQRYRSRPVRPASSRTGGTKHPLATTSVPTTNRTAPAIDPPSRPRHVTVSIPHHGPSHQLRAAVESVLAQTHRALTCVVVSDGDSAGLDVIADLDDPRLIRHVLAQNRGRYFADQVVLDATSTPYFLVHDSDDWSEPTRVSRLLEELEGTGADVCASDVIHHDTRSGTMRTWRHGWPRLHEPVSPQLVERAGHQGLYRTDIIRKIGGWYGGYRIGFDTAVLNLVMMVGGQLVSVAEPLYHRDVDRPVNAFPTTARNTPERRRAIRQLCELHRRAYDATKVGTAQEAVVEIQRLVSACAARTMRLRSEKRPPP